PLVDTEGTAFALLAGGPRDPNWTAKNNQALQSFPASLFPPSELPRWGPFYTKSVGISMGGGQEKPKPFSHGILNALILAQLLATEPFQRIAGFVNGMFESYAPQLHAYYRTTMESLYREMPNLPRNYDEFTSVFAAATFNFGLWTISFPHLDFANLAWGWCAVMALGAFDPDKGGHLILRDLRLVIRFPPGCTILIPSAILRHSNISIQQGEMQYSFTQYTAAGIFRYVANGFRTEKQVDLSKMSKAEKVQRVEERKTGGSRG
ncbi:hypothetical protein B0H13DRAFT_1608498, partial [Mycena leptocephala]